MPGSVNVVFNEVVDPVKKTLLPVDQLRQLFTEHGIDLDDAGKGIVNSCGSGVTASVTFFALEVAGAKGQLSLYDGSWAEYARNPESKIDNKGPYMSEEK